MEARRDKAGFRSLKKDATEKHGTRLSSPLVRYNEAAQPVCRVCNVALKSESLWAAHTAGRSHNEAVGLLKRRAGVVPLGGAASGNRTVSETSSPEVRKARTASDLPADFFQAEVMKQARRGSALLCSADSPSEATELDRPTVRRNGDAQAPQVITQNVGAGQAADRGGQAPALPAGFFDNRDADHKARGVEAKKDDMRDAMKEFENAMEEELQGVDSREEQEEAEAAEEREHREVIIQRSIRERVDLLRHKRMERAEATAVGGHTRQSPENDRQENAQGEVEDDGDDFEVLDWRAKQL